MKTNPLTPMILRIIFLSLRNPNGRELFDRGDDEFGVRSFSGMSDDRHARRVRSLARERRAKNIDDCRERRIRTREFIFLNLI